MRPQKIGGSGILAAAGSGWIPDQISPPKRWPPVSKKRTPTLHMATSQTAQKSSTLKIFCLSWPRRKKYLSTKCGTQPSPYG